MLVLELSLDPLLVGRPGLVDCCCPCQGRLYWGGCSNDVVSFIPRVGWCIGGLRCFVDSCPGSPPDGIH